MHGHLIGSARFVHQPMRLHLPDGMHASADLRSKVNTQLQANLNVDVPIRQTLLVNLPKEVSGQSHIESSIPIDTTINHRFTVNVSTLIDTPVKVARWLPEVQVKFPLQLQVPVDVTVPVKARVPLNLTLLAKASMPPSIHLPVSTRMNVDVPIRQSLDIETVSRAQFALRTDSLGIPIDLLEATLKVPMSGLAFGRRSAHPAGQ